MATRKGQEKRGEILSAALDLFARQGFEGTSIRQIARAADLNEGTLYHYFAGKEAIFDAILSERGYGADQVGADLDGDTGLEAGLARVAERFIALLRQNMALTALLFREGIRFPAAETAPALTLLRLVEGRRLRLAEWLGTVRPAASAEVRDFAARHFLNSLVAFWVSEGFVAGRPPEAMGIEAYVAHLIRATEAGLKSD